MTANARAGWDQRRGLLLRLEEDGFEGFGEASPLPDYSPDSLEQAEADLQCWRARGCPDEVASLASPAARFAVEAALLDLSARREGRPLWQLLGGAAAPKPLPVCGLLGPGNPASCTRQARELYERGFRCFKLKVGPAIAAESRRLAALRGELGAGVSLRLDANRSLPPEKLLDALETWSVHGIEFIEEPGESMPASSRIPLALDESLQLRAAAGSPVESAWRQVEAWTDGCRCDAVVLKPTTLGLGVSRTLAERAREAGLKVVISHCFEGPVALQACAHLALAVGATCAAGLAAHAGLEAWPVVDGKLVQDAWIDPKAVHGPGLGLDLASLWRALAGAS